jgi:hypothetical protein
MDRHSAQSTFKSGLFVAAVALGVLGLAFFAAILYIG